MNSIKSFKIVLDPEDITSYTGTGYNNNYNIDLTRIIRNKEDYNKNYYMYCTFISTTATSAASTVSTALLYTLTIKLSNKINNIYQNINNNLYSFILPIQVNPSDDGTGLPHVGFLLQDKDQRPIFIENLNNINNINLKVLQNGLLCTSNQYYICTLTFVEC